MDNVYHGELFTCLKYNILHNLYYLLIDLLFTGNHIIAVNCYLKILNTLIHNLFDVFFGI